MFHQSLEVAVVGAGAAGLFAALRAKALKAGLSLAVLEASSRPLRKVAISGGGRCNVTHHCDDLELLVGHYPRGGHRLGSILSRFMPSDTRAWFESRGVSLKVEEDGRIFPISNDSATIVEALLAEARRREVPIWTDCRVHSIQTSPEGFQLKTSQGPLSCRRVLVAAGGSAKAFGWAEQLGHRVVDGVPSLFTFKIRDPRLKGLQGVSLPQVVGSLSGVTQQGPLLVTHWGLSGPVVLRLSAWAARELFACQYKSQLLLDLVPAYHQDALRLSLLEEKARQKAQIGNRPAQGLPKRLWERLLTHAGIQPTTPWPQVPKKGLNRLSEQLKRATFTVSGKGMFKEEFVTAGGVPLAELDLQTMESKICPGLFFAGEVLDVDGLTGGFNFQNAWASGWVAGAGLC